MDKHTFGDSKAAVNLLRTLEEPDYYKYRRVVSSVLAEYFSQTASIMGITDITLRKAVLKVWHERFTNRVSQLEIPEVIKTHTQCVGTSRFRQYWHESELYQNKDRKFIPVIDCPICGAKDAPLSFEAEFQHKEKGRPSIIIWSCSNCGKVPNVAGDMKIKRYISINDSELMGYTKEKQYK